MIRILFLLAYVTVIFGYSPSIPLLSRQKHSKFTTTAHSVALDTAKPFERLRQWMTRFESETTSFIFFFLLLSLLTFFLCRNRDQIRSFCKPCLITSAVLWAVIHPPSKFLVRIAKASGGSYDPNAPPTSLSPVAGIRVVGFFVVVQNFIH